MKVAKNDGGLYSDDSYVQADMHAWTPDKANCSELSLLFILKIF